MMITNIKQFSDVLELLYEFKTKNDLTRRVVYSLEFLQGALLVGTLLRLVSLLSTRVIVCA